MISPTNIVEYVNAKAITDRAYYSVLEALRPEFFIISKAEKVISISFTLLANETNPRITAFYEDGVGEPEVYVDRDDWDNFNSLEFSHLKSPSTDILLDTIKYEFRKDMQRFFKISQVSDNFLELLLFKRENSTIHRTEVRKLEINFIVEEFAVTLEFNSGKTSQISITKTYTNGYGPTSDFPPLTENIDLDGYFDPIKATERVICKFRNAIDLADSVMLKVSNLFHPKGVETFPSIEVMVDHIPIKVFLNSDYAHICISARGKRETVSLEHMDIAHIVEKITKLASESLSDVD